MGLDPAHQRPSADADANTQQTPDTQLRNHTRLRRLGSLLVACVMPFSRATLKTVVVQTNPLVHLGIAGLELVENFAPKLDKAPGAVVAMLDIVGDQLNEHVETTHNQVVNTVAAGHDLGYKARSAINEAAKAVVLHVAYSKTFGQHKHKQTALICGATTTLNRDADTIELGETVANGAIDAANNFLDVAEQVCKGLDQAIEALKDFGEDVSEAVLQALEALAEKLRNVKDWFKDVYRNLDNAAETVQDRLRSVLDGILKSCARA